MRRVHIKRIFAADFRKNARTIYDEIRLNKRLWCGDLANDEAYLFVSHMGNQLIFVLGDVDVTSRPGTRFETRRRLLDYRGWRIEGGSFNPSMLEDYANQVGLTLGRESFADYWEKRYR